MARKPERCPMPCTCRDSYKYRRNQMVCGMAVYQDGVCYAHWAKQRRATRELVAEGMGRAGLANTHRTEQLTSIEPRWLERARRVA